MRGRKIDSEFLSNFISECISNNKTTTDEILAEAKSRISFIDDKIKEVEKLRLVRGKLLDVVLSFEKPDKSNKVNESKSLVFFKIENPHISKFICDNIKDTAIEIESLYGSDDYSMKDIIFSIKQLLECKVIVKHENYLMRGELFQEYIKHVLREQ